MTLAPWRSPLSRALHRNRSLPYARYAQLATVRTDGRPANRTIVFRGFLEETNQLKFVTDTRSDKVDHIHTNPWGELCWYFPNTREQFRLLGRLTRVDEDDPDPSLRQARQSQWQELSDSARLQFAWPHPGKPRAADNISSNNPFDPPPPQDTLPLPPFCLLLLNPTQVDHLELRGEPQNRYRYSEEDEMWSVVEINP